MCNEPRDERPDPVEATLAELRPEPSSIDRDALLYAAGYAAGCASRETRPVLRVWQATACVAAAACVALLVKPWSQEPPLDPAPSALARADIDPLLVDQSTTWDLNGPLTVRPPRTKRIVDHFESPTDARVEAPQSMRRLLNELLIDLNPGDKA